MEYLEIKAHTDELNFIIVKNYVDSGLGMMSTILYVLIDIICSIFCIHHIYDNPYSSMYVVSILIMFMNIYLTITRFVFVLPNFYYLLTGTIYRNVSIISSVMVQNNYIKSMILFIIYNTFYVVSFYDTIRNDNILKIYIASYFIICFVFVCHSIGMLVHGIKYNTCKMRNSESNEHIDV